MKAAMWCCSSLAVLFVLTAGCALPSFTNVHSKGPADQKSSEAPDMSVQDMYLTEQGDGGDLWRLLAREASFYDTKQMVLMHVVQAQLISDPLQTIYISADYGQLNSVNGDVSIHGGVQMQYLHDYTIETDVLHWQAANRSLQTDAPVRIVSAFVEIAGMGLYGNADQQSFMIRNNVHASFQLP